MDAKVVYTWGENTGVLTLGVRKSSHITIGLTHSSQKLYCPLSLSLSASKNVSDWWLAYWISHSHDHPGTNLTHTSPPPSPTHTLSLTAATVDGGGRVWGGLASGALVNETVLKEAQDNLEFYLAIYGGLAAANSVSSLNSTTHNSREYSAL